MSEQHVTIGNGNTIHNLVVAEKIENSFNSLQESKASDEVKTLLQQLLTEITNLNGKVPEQVIQTIADEADTLIAESSRETPRKKYYEASLSGILEAAKSVVEAAPIFEIATKLSPFLLSF